MGTNTKHPKLQDEPREGTTGLELEDFGNAVKVFQPQTAVDKELLFWGPTGIIRSSRGTPGLAGDSLRRGDCPAGASILQDFFFSSSRYHYFACE